VGEVDGGAGEVRMWERVGRGGGGEGLEGLIGLVVEVGGVIGGEGRGKLVAWVVCDILRAIRLSWRRQGMSVVLRCL